MYYIINVPNKEQVCRSMKIIEWDKHARDTIRGFSKNIRFEIGKYLRQLQNGENLSRTISKQMSTIMSGAAEIRVKDKDGQYRVFYFHKQAERIIVFHAFVKKTQKTPKKELDTGRERLKNMLRKD